MEEKSKFTLFGRDLERIPCFKKTFTYGIYTGVACGLGHFLFTSKVKKSTDIAVYTFTAASLSFWFYCRYQWAKERAIVQKMDAVKHEVIVSGGIEKKLQDA